MNPNNHISNKLFFIDLALVIGVIVFCFALVIPKLIKIDTPEMQVVQQINPFEKLQFEAQAVLVLDVNTDKILYAKNESAPLALASLTKLMMALTAVHLAPENYRVTIKKEFLVEEGDTGLIDGESWSLADLLDFSLIVSSNDAARSVASVIGAFDKKTFDTNLGREDFIQKMNEMAGQIGLKETHFTNESGLDVADSGGGYGSALDVAHLLKYILVTHPELLEATKYKVATISSETKNHEAKNTNTIVQEIPGLIASKTGFTKLAGGNLVIAFDASIGRPIIAVVLGSTEKSRFDDMKKLVETTMEYVRMEK